MVVLADEIVVAVVEAGVRVVAARVVVTAALVVVVSCELAPQPATSAAISAAATVDGCLRRVRLRALADALIRALASAL